MAGPPGGKFQIRNRKWDIGILLGSLVVLALGFGGLFVLQAANGIGTPTLFFVLFLGLVTFAFFAGPGIVYVARKRIGWLKKRLPGGSMTWIRSHLYLPVLALVAAIVHATVVPFRDNLTSGKMLLVVGVLVSIAGVCRHHLIGIQKAAINVNVAISKLATGKPRDFRRLVADFTDSKRPIAEIDAEMARFDPDLQATWAKIKDTSAHNEKYFPRTGGQSMTIRQYKLWRALHPPLTILLFGLLAYHMYDVLGVQHQVFGDKQDQFAASGSCGSCHSQTFDEWKSSSMAHAQTSTITKAQLPVTLAENKKLADDPPPNGAPDDDDQGPGDQAKLFQSAAAVCTTCHAQVGAQFQANNDSLLPFDQAGSATVQGDAGGKAVSGGGDAVQTDGVGCTTCHQIDTQPDKLAGAFGPITPGAGQTSLGGYDQQFGPPLDNPNPIPTRVHNLDTNAALWADPVQSSQICAACHDVKLDIDDGKTGAFDDDTDGSVILDADKAKDADSQGKFSLFLDANELDDDDGKNGADDLVLQTTYDEWQDYIAFFDSDETDANDQPAGYIDRYSAGNLTTNPLGLKDLNNVELTNEADTDLALDDPTRLGCTDCHMPTASVDDSTSPLVDHGAGFINPSDRPYRSHTFVGVDYDLDPAVTPDDQINSVLAEREALVRSAVALTVQNDSSTADATVDGKQGQILFSDVTVRNNALAHTFPTGFAFARQFWLEVSATDKDGNAVCLAPIEDDTDSTLIPTPCASGVLAPDDQNIVKNDPSADGLPDITSDDVADNLRQCDTVDVAKKLLDGLGVADADNLVEQARTNGGKIDLGGGTVINVPNMDIDFAEDPTGANQVGFQGSFAGDQCDPWLVNFQKILTDGDPDGDGIRQEVPYQPFLADAVQIRGRVATSLANPGTAFQQVKDLQPVRLDANDNQQQAETFPYQFFVPNGVDPADVTVKVTMRFRHLPPYLIDDIAGFQKQIKGEGFNVPAGADIEGRTDDLLKRLTVTEVGTATSDDDTEQVGCDKGPQNVKNGTVLDCVKDPDKPEFTVLGAGIGHATPPPGRGGPLDPDSVPAGELALGALLGLVAVGSILGLGSRRGRRGGRPVLRPVPIPS